MRELAGREIGARIAAARKQAGAMTQDELADLLGVTMRSVQNYESGDTIPWRHFKRLEEIFQCPLEWFLHGDEAAKSPSDVDALLRQALGERADEQDRQHEEVMAAISELAEQLRAIAADRARQLE